MTIYRKLNIENTTSDKFIHFNPVSNGPINLLYNDILESKSHSKCVFVCPKVQNLSKMSKHQNNTF